MMAWAPVAARITTVTESKAAMIDLFMSTLLTKHMKANIFSL
jgi:hypothetical protein